MATLTVMIPAYNEEKNLRDAVASVLNAVSIEEISDYEILIFDDCSTDSTGDIADEIASTNSKIKVFHNEENMGFGYNYSKGLNLATMEYYCLFPGDNENEGESFKDILTNIGKADMVLSYTANREVRKFKRRVISWLYNWAINCIFTMNMRYYNGINIYPVKILREIEIDTFSFAFNAEIIVRLVKRGYSYIEVPAFVKPTAKSSALTLKNIFGVIGTIARLSYEVNIRRKI